VSDCDILGSGWAVGEAYNFYASQSGLLVSNCTIASGALAIGLCYTVQANAAIDGCAVELCSISINNLAASTAAGMFYTCVANSSVTNCNVDQCVIENILMAGASSNASSVMACGFIRQIVASVFSGNTVTNSQVTGTLGVYGFAYTGSVLIESCGVKDTTVSRVANTSGTGANYASGFMYSMSAGGILSKCYAVGVNVSMVSNGTGNRNVYGLVGTLAAGNSVLSCVFKGSLSFPSTQTTLTGIFGICDMTVLATVSNCYCVLDSLDFPSNGTTGTAAAGLMRGTSTNLANVSKCYCVGNYNASSAGSVAWAVWRAAIAVTSGTLTKADCFYFATMLPGSRAFTGGTEAAQAQTQAAMQDQSTYTAAGWDFASVWAIDPAKNGGYPYLQWEDL